MLFFIIIVLVGGGFLFWFNVNKRFFPKKIKEIENHIAKEELKEAHNLLETLPTDFKNNKEVVLLYYSLYKKEKQYFLAIYELEKILHNDNFTKEEKIDLHFKKAELFHLVKKEKDAYQEYEKILSLDDKNDEANFQIGRYFYNLKFYKKALPFLQNSFANERRVLDAKQMVFDILIQEQKAMEADSLIKEVINHLKENAKEIPCVIMHKQALARYLLDKFSEALTIINKIDESYQKNEELSLIKALCLFELKEEEKAKNIFEKILVQYKDNYHFLFLKSRYIFTEILLEDKRVKEAVEQINYIAEANQPFLENDQRKKKMEELVKKDLAFKLFSKDSIAFILKTKNAFMSDNNLQFVKTSKWGSFCFAHMFKNKMNELEILFYYFHLKEISDNKKNEIADFIEKLNEPISQFVVYSLWAIDLKFIKERNNISNINKKIYTDFILHLQLLSSQG